MFPYWNRTMIAVSVSFHSVAILSTLFRLWYRWHTHHMWWDDAWAALALLADIPCLIVAALQQPIPGAAYPRFFSAGNWVVSFAYPTLMWVTRISILTSIVRVSLPEDKLKRIAMGIGILFGLMWIAMFAMRIQNCIANGCLMVMPLLKAQTTNCIADVLLSAIPICFLRRVKLTRHKRILVSSALSASMVINVVTVVQAVAFFQSITSGSIVYEHVKVACSLIVCNLLVIVTFVYRVLRKGNVDMKGSPPLTSKIEFTTIDPAQVELSQEIGKGMSLSVPSGTSTKSSTWSFHASSLSKNSVSAAATTTTASRILDMEMEMVDDRSINVVRVSCSVSGI